MHQFRFPACNLTYLYMCWWTPILITVLCCTADDRCDIVYFSNSQVTVVCNIKTAVCIHSSTKQSLELFVSNWYWSNTVHKYHSNIETMRWFIFDDYFDMRHKAFHNRFRMYWPDQMLNKDNAPISSSASLLFHFLQIQFTFLKELKSLL